MNLQESPTLKGRKIYVQLGHCGPRAINLLTMNSAAAVCYFAFRCLCKIGLEVSQLMRRLQQNKRLAKISKVDLKKAVKAGCVQNLWLSLTRHSYSAISWTSMPTQIKREIIQGLCDKLSRNQLNFKSLVSLTLNQYQQMFLHLQKHSLLGYLILLMLGI